MADQFGKFKFINILIEIHYELYIYRYQQHLRYLYLFVNEYVLKGFILLYFMVHTLDK